MSTTNHPPTCIHLNKTSTANQDDIPPLDAAFFYNSPLPIDDPLSAVPPATSGESVKHPPRPFSEYDNNALEEGWAVCREQDNIAIPVGISRLHVVKLPSLVMNPIYWAPVHDIAAVIRGTWFYKDTMYPVEPSVANQLESGYRELRPWSQTWKDELNSAIEVGAAGEEKISHRIWPEDESLIQELINPEHSATAFYNEAAAGGVLEVDSLTPKAPDTKPEVKYLHGHVIYTTARNAFILKPSLQPSAYFGRKPLQKLKKGINVGIPVVRGFSRQAWEKIHPSKRSKTASKAQKTAAQSGNANSSNVKLCEACKSQEDRPKVKDLILVVHGIGQKLSERVESFHFTHAINAFRRQVNVELVNKQIQSVLRDDLEGIMVLPINWRASLTFEEGGFKTNGDEDHSKFSLKDITPDTIPAVRNIISDVMLDIPFYMSGHKPKMIKAVISEANRVYGLWCRNNPDFHENGRVHLIAHSLGSAMAMEILSKQPLRVPKLDFERSELNTDCFDFNTTNLFFAGSPAGFFLLLDKANLTPRRGQDKPGTDYDDDDTKTAADAGTMGCLAVDNIYNIIAANDPIAYRLNATVDPVYANSLKIAQVPSATVGLLESIGIVIKNVAPGVAPGGAGLPVGQIAKPSIPRLPSQVEMAVHDFTREELAERKFFLLNDNGQIDFFLSSGGGALEIQYINMLGAHSSYWTSADFIRMIVLEVGRNPGKDHCLPNMKAIKKPGYK